MKCKCKQNCIKTKKELLTDITKLYEPCPSCNNKGLKKAIPLKNQIKLEKLDEQYKKCPQCKKRHIDIVIAHSLKILIEEKQISSAASIRKIGTPLITPAIYLEHLPYLSENTLVLIIKEIDHETAQKIVQEVPEVKAIIKGDTNTTIGLIDENNEVNNYELMAGCDVRCDIQNTDEGCIVLYKPQANIHIEYPKENSPKIIQLKKILEKYEHPTVIDALAGPGTLGIYALYKNASKVIFNDLNKTATQTLKLNLEINQIEESMYEIYNENILDLPKVLDDEYDIGIIDAFPSVETWKYEEILKKICKEVVII